MGEEQRNSIVLGTANEAPTEEEQLEANNKSVKFNMDNNKSVTFATFDNNDAGGTSRVAAMKARFSKSLDDSYSNNDDDLSMSSSGSDNDDDDDDDDEDDDDSEELDDSFGELAELGAMMSKSGGQSAGPMSFNMSFMHVGLEDDDYDIPAAPGSDAMGTSMMDASSTGMGQSRRVGGPGGGRRNTGRGSIFVIADEKFGQTKVVQARLEKAAKKLQRFFRRCLLILRQYTEERDYLANEKIDIEARRVEELEDVQRYLQEEKERFKLELEQEWNAGIMTPEEWDKYHKEQADLKEQTDSLKTENETLKEDIKQLKRENNKLEIVDPEREAERARLEKDIPKMIKDQEDWTQIGNHYQAAIKECNGKIELVTVKRKITRTERKQIQTTMTKIIKLLEAPILEAQKQAKERWGQPQAPEQQPQGDDKSAQDPASATKDAEQAAKEAEKENIKMQKEQDNQRKVLQRVKKLKKKSEKKLKKLKKQTMMERQKSQRQLFAGFGGKGSSLGLGNMGEANMLLMNRRKSMKKEKEDDAPPAAADKTTIPSSKDAFDWTAKGAGSTHKKESKEEQEKRKQKEKRRSTKTKKDDNNNDDAPGGGLGGWFQGNLGGGGDASEHKKSDKDKKDRRRSTRRRSVTHGSKDDLPDLVGSAHSTKSKDIGSSHHSTKSKDIGSSHHSKKDKDSDKKSSKDDKSKDKDKKDKDKSKDAPAFHKWDKDTSNNKDSSSSKDAKKESKDKDKKDKDKDKREKDKHDKKKDKDKDRSKDEKKDRARRRASAIASSTNSEPGALMELIKG